MSQIEWSFMHMEKETLNEICVFDCLSNKGLVIPYTVSQKNVNQLCVVQLSGAIAL